MWLDKSGCDPCAGCWGTSQTDRRPPNCSGVKDASFFPPSLWPVSENDKPHIPASVYSSVALPLGNKTFTLLPYLAFNSFEFQLWKWISLTFHLSFHNLCTEPQEVVQNQNGVFVPSAGPTKKCVVSDRPLKIHTHTLLKYPALE